MSLFTGLERRCLNSCDEAMDNPEITRRAMRVGIRRLRHSRIPRSEADQGLMAAEISRLNDLMRMDYRARFGIDPVMLSILLQILFAVAGLLLQWWWHRHEKHRATSGHDLASLVAECDVIDSGLDSPQPQGV